MQRCFRMGLAGPSSRAWHVRSVTQTRQRCVAKRFGVVAQAAQTARMSSFRGMSQQVKDMRAQMEEDEQLKILMSGLRGNNLDQTDFADASVQMRLVEVTDGADGDVDILPLQYDPVLIAEYWSRRPVAVTTRIFQLLSIAGGFLGKFAYDFFQGRLAETEVARAIELRNIVTSLGPAYIKLGQALSIRPDVLSPAAMNELQKLCDKVPSFDNEVAMNLIQSELGKPWQELYAELTAAPIAAASLGQVYKGRLMTGEPVAVKVQRPYVLETVTVDLFIIRKLGIFLRRFPAISTDVVGLLDEWAARFFDELDYVKEGESADRFASLIAEDLPQVVVPRTYHELTSRRVLTAAWIDGEKLSQSTADDVGTLVNVGVICYLKQLLDTGFFHADPHPGNLIRTPDGRLAILDFGLMTQVDDDIKYGMIEAIAHLIHRDYEAIVEDFVTLQFIPPGTDLRPILPVLAKVFDQALEGGGAKSINFQELAADLAQITFDYPFRIPPYFALIIRAIGVLEGIALVATPDFALVDEAYPYISKRLMTDNSPRLRESLRYMVYGKDSVFDADRLIDLLDAFEVFTEAAKSARGNLDIRPDWVPTTTPSTPLAASSTAPATGYPASATGYPAASTSAQSEPARLVPGTTSPSEHRPSSMAARAAHPQGSVGGQVAGWLPPPRTDTASTSAPATQHNQQRPFTLPFPFPPFPFPTPSSRTSSDANGAIDVEAYPLGTPAGLLAAMAAPLTSLRGLGPQVVPWGVSNDSEDGDVRTREALKFVFSPEGAFFRDFLMEEVVKSVDALSRDQARSLLATLGLQNAMIPVLLPGASRLFIPLAPSLSNDDRRTVENVAKVVDFLTGGRAARQAMLGGDPRAARELLPFLPAVATQVLPELSSKLLSRVAARVVREVFLPQP